MGIRYLNSILRDSCPDSIRCISLTDLSGKKIAIDVSIYMYKYETEDLLIENMYLLMAILRNYNIIPIFIFDGKAPTEKKELLDKRRSDKLVAENEYNQLKIKYNTAIDEDKQDLESNMNRLKKQFVYMNKEKINIVKDLISSYGMQIYDAPGEADELCAMLVIKKKVWACMSEDMDLFVYGCTRVIRYFSLINHTAVLYYTKGILKELAMTQKEFREICVISGTDYNLNANFTTKSSRYNTNININIIVKLFYKFKGSLTNMDFYKWLDSNYINDYELLIKINKIFDLSCNHEHLQIFDKIKSSNGQINRTDLKLILEEDGFMFLD